MTLSPLKKKYVVTGGAGFIGSHLTDLLISEGHTVRVLDNLATGFKENINSKAELIVCDLVNDKMLSNHLKGFDAVFHLAAMPRIQPSFSEPLIHDDANVRTTLQLLMAMKTVGMQSMVYSSSSSVYGDAEEVPTSEKCAISPLSPYALQKYTGEQYAIILGKHYGIRTNALRYFNVYGPRSYSVKNPQSAYSSVVGIFNHAKQTGKPCLVTGDGTQTRDFVHVFDVAQANLRLELSNAQYEALNLGRGENYSINDIVKLFDGRIEYISARPGEAMATLADVSRLKKVLNWSPTISLKEAVEEGLI